MRWRSSSNFANLPLVVDPLLHDSPYRIVDGVKIRTIRRPQTWLDEIRRDFFRQLDRLAEKYVMYGDKTHAISFTGYCRYIS